MFRILRIVNRFNIGGPTYNAAWLSKGLYPAYETRLIAGTIDPTEGSSAYLLDELGLEYRILPEMRRAIHPLRDYRAYQQLCREIREFKPDIVHTHASKAGALGRLAALHEQVPVIVHTFHGNVMEGYFNPLITRAILSIERYLARHSSAVVAISPCQKHELHYRYRLCEPQKIVTIPLGFDLERFGQDREFKRQAFRQKHGLTDEIAIGIIGRLVPIKDHALFLNSVAWLKGNTDRAFRVFIIGDGELRKELEHQAAELGLGQDLLRFCGWEKKMEDVIPGLDIVALTSRNEGTPVSLIEAQASGVAIVSTRVGGVSDTVRDTCSGLLCNSRNPEEFGQILKQVCEQDRLREKLSQGGKAFVMHRYAKDRLVSDAKNLYSALLKRSGKYTILAERSDNDAV